MKRVAVITFSVALPGEKGLPRMYYLAGRLAMAGYAVDLITSTFQHWEKKQRAGDAAHIPGAGFSVVLLSEPGYHKNIQLRRLLSHRVFARNVFRYLQTHAGYDLMYCMIPDNYLAAGVGSIARRRGIPFVLDIEDLWPEAMRMALDIPLLSGALFYPLARQARRAYALCDAVIASSDTYRDEPLRYGIRVANSTTVYVGNDAEQFRRGAAAHAGEFAGGDFHIAYAGTIGVSYDIFTLLRAADLVTARGYRLRVTILGDGPQREACQRLAANLSGTVTFAGYLPYERMAACLTDCDATVNMLSRKAPQSIVSKIGDYLCAGKPLINTGADPEFRAIITQWGFGVNVAPGDPKGLADAIIGLMEDNNARAGMGAAALRAARLFDRSVTYDKIVRVCDGLTGDKP
jgi:glycosyltransferase involved in cell wall biosynthesis